MKKTIIIVIVLVLLVGVSAISVLFFSAKSPTVITAPSGVGGLPIAQNANPPATSGGNAQPVLSLPATTGGTLSTNNFLADPNTYPDPINPGYYSLGYSVNQPDSTSTPPFLIVYQSATKFFAIVLLQEPIGPIRMQVEQYLERHLGLSQNDLCNLNYTLSVPNSVNEQFAGENLGFSSCPGATVLPQ